MKRLVLTAMVLASCCGCISMHQYDPFTHEQILRSIELEGVKKLAIEKELQRISRASGVSLTAMPNVDAIYSSDLHRLEKWEKHEAAKKEK